MNRLGNSLGLNERWVQWSMSFPLIGIDLHESSFVSDGHILPVKFDMYELTDC